jgi:anti-sigma factor RsiW
MMCPVAFETLVALWCRELDDVSAAHVEEHLFACDPCAAASDRIGNLIEGVRHALPPVISHAHLERLLGDGKQIVRTVVEPGIAAHARFAPGVDLLVHVLRAPISGAERVDVDLMSADGTPRIPFEHVPFDRARGEVLIACQRHYEEFPFEPVYRVHAVEGGVRRPLGDYVVHHVWQ